MASLLQRSCRIPATARFAPKRIGVVGKHSSIVSRPSKDTISWAEYLEIRRRKRRWETVCRSHHSGSFYLLNALFQGLNNPFFASRAGGRGRVLWIFGNGRDQTNHGEPPFMTRVQTDGNNACIRELTPYSSMELVQWRVQVS